MASCFPLLIGVPFDGLVIYGQAWLAPLLAQTRRDVWACGIRRTETGGWRYLVLHRQNTPLSPVGNANWARKWLEGPGREPATSFFWPSDTTAPPLRRDGSQLKEVSTLPARSFSGGLPRQKETTWSAPDENHP